MIASNRFLSRKTTGFFFILRSYCYSEFFVSNHEVARIHSVAIDFFQLLEKKVSIENFLHLAMIIDEEDLFGLRIKSRVVHDLRESFAGLLRILELVSIL